MRIVFTSEVLDRQEAWKHLTRVLYKVDDGWHLWEVDNPDLIEESGWYKRRAGDDFLDLLLRKSALRSVWDSDSGLHSQRVVIVDAPSSERWKLEPETAVRALEEPVRVIVEDRESDGRFLGVVVRTLGAEELVELYECTPPAVVVESPGGAGKIRRHVKADLRDFRDRGIPPRLFILFDSDAPRPDEPSREASRIKNFCEKKNLPHHMLAKRAIENYVPQGALEVWAGKRENASYRRSISQLESLTRTQRDHLPKRGFHGGTPPASGDLYDDLSEEQKRTLAWPRRTPFELVLRDHAADVTADDLRDRCGPPETTQRTELDRLLKALARLL